MQYITYNQEELAVMTELDDEEVVDVVGGILGGLFGGLFGGTEAPEAPEPVEVPEPPEGTGTNTNSNNDVDGENNVNVTQQFSILNLFQGSNISPAISVLGGSATSGSNSYVNTTNYNIINTR